MFLSMFLFVAFALRDCEQSQSFLSSAYESNTLSCSNDRKCTFIENCPAISNLMDRNLLPIHRFRQAICAYENRKPKICCDAQIMSTNPFFTNEDGMPRKPISVPECGKSLIRSNVDTVGSYPFVARLGFISTTGEMKYSCSGAILNERTILTTASCALAKSEEYKLCTVLVGEFDGTNNPDCNSLFCGHESQNYNISYIIKHPDYHPGTFANNIAMLRLTDPIQFSVTAQPVCLLPGDRFINVGSISTLVGWGKLSGQIVKSATQQSLTMKVLQREDCSIYYNQGMSVELCAVGDEMPCSGFNGSPLLLKYGDTYFLVGILSYGSKCNTNSNFPSVFVNVQRYIRWILENC